MRQEVLLLVQVGPGAVKVPDKRNEALWCHMLLGGAAWRRICAARDRGEEAAAAKLEVEGEQPALNFVMTMSGVACEQVRGCIFALTLLITSLCCRCWSTACRG